MRKSLILFSFNFFLFQLLYGQCYITSQAGPPWNGVSPAFAFNIPGGVTVTSVKVVIKNYSHGGGHYRARIRSFKDLKTVSVFGDGEYEVLNFPTSGPGIQDLQVESGIGGSCGLVGDFVKFEWEVKIEATGLGGTLINYSAQLTDNLAIPTNLGSVYNGTNRVSGVIDFKTNGTGIVLYVDYDHDGFGDPSQPTITACDVGCHYDYSSNKLDCNDDNALIHPGKKEIPYNGKDDDCNPSTLDDDLDKDGFLISIDCDDSDPAINPNQEDFPGNGIDENCNGSDLIITSIGNKHDEDISIYPNPASDFIYVKSGGLSDLYTELWNPAGQKILAYDGESEIPVSGVAAGIYFLKIRIGTTRAIVRKVVIAQAK